eukprot:TRINITY_DN12596_c1_g1_i3.p1 TRINITY_DN12596_c1_g1~~TRINITY_DN12596_c1_g1_i3.p1  ORF type:complete len:523 (+),score=118.70 TRINITY_DN12596_c1_g1_i3:48-1571(+)
MAAKPNVLFVLTDDQDEILGSLSVMPRVNELLVKKGMKFSNAFANTPICCPSRAEITSGRLMHNTKVIDNSCGGTAWQKGPETNNMAHFMNSQGNYSTYYSGKYLNNYGSPDVGGTAHIPPGWTSWHALVGNSKYYNYDVSEQGQKVHFGSDYATDYYTDKLKNDSVAWLLHEWNQDTPFFMQIGTPAPHVPNTFAPQYAKDFDGQQSPRTPNWNLAPANATGPGGKHWMMRHFGPMDPDHIVDSDAVFADRWRVLQSVDVMVEELVTTLDKLGQLNNTYIIYSSDHGQHLGQFGMAFDKRQLYETDIRVPLIVRGPGIAPGSTSSAIATHVDLAATILDMGGIAKPDMMDGRSWLPVAQGQDPKQLNWRQDFLIEYGGPKVDMSELEGVQGKNDCGDGYDCQGLTMCGGEHGTCPCDAVNNTYKCLRTLSATEDSIYCEFDDSESFVEWYDIAQDPWEMNNLHETGDPAKKAALHARLHQYMLCSGDDCFNPSAQSPRMDSILPVN